MCYCKKDPLPRPPPSFGPGPHRRSADLNDDDGATSNSPSAWNAAHRARLQERAQAEAERKKDLLAEAAGKLEALQAERARDLAAKIKTNRAAQEAAPFSALACKLAEADPDRPAAESWELVCELLEGQTIEKLGAFKSTMLKLKAANF